MSGRTIIITGGGTGIGFAMAQRFARSGDRVAICSRHRATVDRARAQIGGDVIADTCDVRDRSQIEAFATTVVNRAGPIHVLVNNAGVGGRNPIEQQMDGFFRETMDTNVRGTFQFTQCVLAHMPADGMGRIINISSVLGKFGVAASSAYCASKHAVIGLTRALALELAPRRITVNAICPGWVDTEMARESMEQLSRLMGVSPEQFRKRALDHVPIRRFVEAEEVAATAFFLASAEAAAITGQAINVCGGQTFY